MDSVTQWISQLKQSGRSEAAEKLWNRYLSRMLHLARVKLGPVPKVPADEEDVAITSFAALLEGIRDKRFSRLEDRDDLWQVLVMLTERKAFSQRRVEWAEKRGGTTQDEALSFDMEASEPSPELAAQLAEEFEFRLSGLQDDLERQIAIKRLQGYQNDEIAASLKVGLRTVERKLSLIRRTWS